MSWPSSFLFALSIDHNSVTVEAGRAKGGGLPLGGASREHNASHCDAKHTAVRNPQFENDRFFAGRRSGDMLMMRSKWRTQTDTHARTPHTHTQTHLSMPKPSMLLSRTSPPKYLAYTRLNGRPIPKPANGGRGVSTDAAAADAPAADGRGRVG